MVGWDQLLAPAQDEGRFYGMAIGVVTNNVDPDNLGRVKVSFPWLSAKDSSHWARIASPMAGKGRGIFFIPEVDDEVLVGFEHGMMDKPYILGALWNGVDKPPEKKDKKVNRRTIKTSSGHVICLDDTKGKEKIEIIDKSADNSIIIDTAKNTITIAAKKDITIQASDGKLVLEGKGVEIKSSAAVKIEAKQAMDLKAGPKLNIKGQMVNIN